MKTKERIFFIGIMCLALICGVCFARTARTNSRYLKLLDENTDLLDLVEQQKMEKESYSSMYYSLQNDYKNLEISNEVTLKQWDSDFNELKAKYDTLLSENDELKARVNSVDIPTYSFTEEEIYLLAQCVEAEAGYYKNHRNSQRYVTQVILNRVACSQFPNSIEEVIYQKIKGVPQFSVAYDGALERHSEVQPETLANVYSAIVHGTDLPKYVLFFYSIEVKNNWVNTLNIYTKCEGTVFAYSSVEDK